MIAPIADEKPRKYRTGKKATDVKRFVSANQDDPALAAFARVYLSLPAEERKDIDLIIVRFCNALPGIGLLSAIELFCALADFFSKPFNYNSRW